MGKLCAGHMQAYIWVVDIADDKMYFILNKDGQGSQTKILSNVYPRLSFVLLYIYFFNLVKIFIVDRSLLPVNIASKRLLSATLASGTIFVYFRAFFFIFFLSPASIKIAARVSRARCRRTDKVWGTYAWIYLFFLLNCTTFISVQEKKMNKRKKKNISKSPVWWHHVHLKIE